MLANLLLIVLNALEVCQVVLNLVSLLKEELAVPNDSLLALSSVFTKVLRLRLENGINLVKSRVRAIIIIIVLQIYGKGVTVMLLADATI